MKLLITGAWKFTDKQYRGLEQMGYDICFIQYEKDELPLEAYDAEAVICNGLFLYHDIEDFKNLKVIQLTSTGYDRVPMDYISEHDIEVYNAKGVYSIPMAEMAICGVLEIYKKSKFFAENQKSHRWEKHRGLLELTDKDVCIIGCGNVGNECAKRFQAFGCKVTGVSRYSKKLDNYDEVVGIEQLDNVLKAADIIIIAIPSTKDTYHLLNRKRITSLKNTAVIVNVARGDVIDTEALIEVLPQIGGAVLDVFEEEPLNEDSNLWDMENVIITPHNSFVGEKVYERLWKVIEKKLSEYRLGR